MSVSEEMVYLRFTDQMIANCSVRTDNETSSVSESEIKYQSFAAAATMSQSILPQMKTNHQGNKNNPIPIFARVPTTRPVQNTGRPPAESSCLSFCLTHSQREASTVSHVFGQRKASALGNILLLLDSVGENLCEHTARLGRSKF